jgi:hypothetical protein
VAAALSFGKSWALINSSSLFQKLALCVAITGIVSEGIADLLVQYLQLVVGFNTADQALLYTIIGAANLVVQVRQWVQGVVQFASACFPWQILD